MERIGLKRKGWTLTRIFWNYLLSVGLSLAGVMVLIVCMFLGLLGTGVLLPANTAEQNIDALERALTTGTLAPEEIPFYYRWACLDDRGEITTHSELSQRRQEQLCEAVSENKTVVSALLFSQYHRILVCPDGTRCVVQYDFSIPYAVPWMRRWLPEYQLLMLLEILLGVVLAIVFWTRRYARKLNQDAMALNAATRAILEQRLDVPFSDQTNVREFGETLEAMDLLRSGLSDALHEQWNMERIRAQEISALAHDLKTPLTVIGGNGELLAEENLSEEQRKSVEAILRNVERMRSYLNQLRLVAAQQNRPVSRRPVGLSDLFVEWIAMGEELCAEKSIRFSAVPPPAAVCAVEVESVSRAVQNLLENAVRYTPEGQTVSLSAEVKGTILRMVVRDSGPGFTEAALAHGCEAFYTEDQSRGGTGHMGMGLYSAQCVARRHGGTLTLSNGENGGVVTLELRLTDQ